MNRFFVRTLAVAALLLSTALATSTADAIPVFANGQGISCQTCHTVYPAMTRYGMMVMMSNFQILDWHLQHQAFPLAMRVKIYSFLANKSQPAQTQLADTSVLGGGFIGKRVTWFAEQHIISSNVAGITEQTWVSYNGLFHGLNSLQIGKFHTPFPFMPAHVWTISNYLLAAQPVGQNIFVPNDAHWGAAFNGMSNEFMYNAAYIAGAQPLQGAFDFNRADSPRTLDLNLSYGGMSIPWTLGVVAMRGDSPVVRSIGNTYLHGDAFTREGIYYAYQNSRWHIQSMLYHGFDVSPDVGLNNVTLNGATLEIGRDFGWRNHVLVRYDIGASDTLNRQYILELGHNIAPNIKLLSELAMGPNMRPQIGFGIGMAGPWQEGKRLLWAAPVGARYVPASPTREHLQTSNDFTTLHGTRAVETLRTSAITPGTPASAAPSASDANAGAKLVAANGCIGCHGANFEGGIGPKLIGIEKRLTTAQITDFIVNPRAPMPNFGFTGKQVSDVVAYLSGLDGGSGATARPVVTWTGGSPSEHTQIHVTFSGVPPKVVTIEPRMEMGGMKMTARNVTLTQSTTDPHVFVGDITFSMSGPWTIILHYDGNTMDIPVNIGGQ